MIELLKFNRYFHVKYQQVVINMSQEQKFIQLQINNSLLIMSSEEYYGYREPRLSNRPQIKRTQLSSQKLIISRSKQREKQRQLEAQQQKLQKLKRKYHQMSIDNKEEGKLKSKKNKYLKSNNHIYLNDLRIRLNHYDDQGSFGYNQAIKEKVEKRALQFLQKNFKTKSDLIPTNGGMVNQKAIQQTQQIIQTRLLNRGSRKKYDGYSSRVGRGQMRSCSTNSQRLFQKRRQENSIQKSERSLNNDNQDYNLHPKNKKNLEINQKQSMVLGTQTIRKPYEEQKNQKSTIKLQNQKKKEEQKNESEISVNSRHENSRITQELQEDYKNIKKLNEAQKNEQVKALQTKRDQNQLIESGQNENRQSYGSVSDSYVNNSINSNMGRNNYNILATSDYERIKQLEKRARDQSFLRSSKSITNVHGNEDMKNGEQFNKLLQQQSSSLDLKYQQAKKEIRPGQGSGNPSSKSNSNTISNLIKNSSDLIKNGEYGQSSQHKYNTAQNKKYINNLYSAMSVSNNNSKMGQDNEAGMEINKQTSVTNANTNIKVQNGNIVKNPNNNITFHNIINSIENSNSNNTNSNKNNSNNNSSNFNLHLNSNHNSNNNSNRNSENISSNTITNIILGRNSNSSKSAQNKSLGLSSDCQNYEQIFKGTKQLEQRPTHVANLNNLNSTHYSLQNISSNQNKANFILNEEIAEKNENISDSINETDAISSQSYIKSKKMVRIPLYYATADQIPSRMDENRSGSLSMSNTNSMMRQDKKQTEIQFQFQQSNQVYSLMPNQHKPNNTLEINNQSNMQRISLMDDGYENNRWGNHSLNNRVNSQESQQSIQNSNNSFNRNCYDNAEEQQFHNNVSQSPIFSFSHKQAPKSEPFVLSDSLKEWNAEEQQQIIQLYTSFGNEQPQLQALMDRYYEHITIVNKIADFISETEQFYLDPQQRQTFHLSMFLLFKFFYQCRLLIIQSLAQGQSCFILTNKEISEPEVHKYYQESCVKQLCSCLLEGNRKLQNILLRFQSYLKERLPDSLINLEQIIKQDLNIITQKLNEELQMLVTKIQEIIQQKSNNLIKDNQYEVISLRAFAIMQLIFLISQLRGRKIKGFEHVIQPEDFEMYCKKYYSLFKETVLYFH